MSPDKTFTFDDLKRILVDRVGLPEDDVTDDPEAKFEDMGLDSLAVLILYGLGTAGLVAVAQRTASG